MNEQQLLENYRALQNLLKQAVMTTDNIVRLSRGTTELERIRQIALNLGGAAQFVEAAIKELLDNQGKAG